MMKFGVKYDDFWYICVFFFQLAVSRLVVKLSLSTKRKSIDEALENKLGNPVY